MSLWRNEVEHCHVSFHGRKLGQASAPKQETTNQSCSFPASAFGNPGQRECTVGQRKISVQKHGPKAPVIPQVVHDAQNAHSAAPQDKNHRQGCGVPCSSRDPCRRFKLWREEGLTVESPLPQSIDTIGFPPGRHRPDLDCFTQRRKMDKKSCRVEPAVGSHRQKPKEEQEERQKDRKPT